MPVKPEDVKIGDTLYLFAAEYLTRPTRLGVVTARGHSNIAIISGREPVNLEHGVFFTTRLDALIWKERLLLDMVRAIRLHKHCERFYPSDSSPQKAMSASSASTRSTENAD